MTKGASTTTTYVNGVKIIGPYNPQIHNKTPTTYTNPTTTTATAPITYTKPTTTTTNNYINGNTIGMANGQYYLPKPQTLTHKVNSAKNLNITYNNGATRNTTLTSTNLKPNTNTTQRARSPTTGYLIPTQTRPKQTYTTTTQPMQTYTTTTQRHHTTTIGNGLVQPTQVTTAGGTSSNNRIVQNHQQGVTTTTGGTAIRSRQITVNGNQTFINRV